MARHHSITFLLTNYLRYYYISLLKTRHQKLLKSHKVVKITVEVLCLLMERSGSGSVQIITDPEGSKNLQGPDP